MVKYVACVNSAADPQKSAMESQHLVSIRRASMVRAESSVGFSGRSGIGRADRVGYTSPEMPESMFTIGELSAPKLLVAHPSGHCGARAPGRL